MRVALFGDSITVGQFVPVHLTWPQRLSQLLAASSHQAGEPNWFISISAVNGRTTREALLDMPYHIQSQNVDILLIQFGLNDCNHWLSDHGCPRVSIDSFRANIDEMIDRARSSGTRVIYVLTPHETLRTQPWTHKPESSLESERQRYAQAIRSIHYGRRGDATVHLLDMEAHLNSRGLAPSDTVLPLPDGLHLNPLGHETFAEIVQDQLRADNRVTPRGS
mgnify:CR=1 FL=1